MVPVNLVKMKNILLKENYASRNLWGKMNLLTEQQVIEISKGLKWTDENLPGAVLVGGTAVVHYISGDRALTPDLDFMVTDIDSVKAELSNNHIEFKDLHTGGEYSLGITVPGFNADYLSSSAGNEILNELILKTPDITIIGGYDVKIIRPELLAIMKLELGRDQDINDGFALLASGKCDLESYKSYVSALKESLKDYEAVVGYQALITS